jgi:hypothetical protein
MTTPVPAYATIDEINKQIIFAPTLIGDAIGVIPYTLVAISADGTHDTLSFNHEVTTNPPTPPPPPPPIIPVISDDPNINIGAPYFTSTNDLFLNMTINT